MLEPATSNLKKLSLSLSHHGEIQTGVYIRLVFHKYILVFIYLHIPYPDTKVTCEKNSNKLVTDNDNATLGRHLTGSVGKLTKEENYIEIKFIKPLKPLKDK